MNTLQTLKHEYDVVIVGAGPTGLTMACELLRRGIRCRILDKAAAPGTSSRAMGVQARTLEVFGNMGIMEKVLSRGVRGMGVKVYERDTLLIHMNFNFLESRKAFLHAGFIEPTVKVVPQV